MSPKPYPLGNANLSTCEWFVPELARWASQLKLDDDKAPTLPTGPHPRLILTAQDIARINRQSAQDPDAKLAFQRLVHSVDRGETKRPMSRRGAVQLAAGLGSRIDERDLIEAALLWRLTNRSTYSELGCSRLMSVLNDSSWYSGDASMLGWGDTMHGVAIAYDWLFEALTPEERRRAAQAIATSLRFYTEGVRQGAGNNFWYNGTLNWNIIVNGGAALGALAVAPATPSDDETLADAAAEALRLSLDGLRSGFAGWGLDDGGWQEGLVYDMYSLMNACDLLNGLTTALGSAAAAPFAARLRHAGDFIVQSIGPSGSFYNWADADNPPTASTAYGHDSLFALARMFGRADWAFTARTLDRTYNASADPGWLRLAASVMYFDSSGTRADVEKRQPLQRLFQSNDVAILRTSWTDPSAMWCGFKGGTNDDTRNRSFGNSAFGHSHLDQGSFVLEHNGVRWAHDLGNDNYEMPGYFGQGRFQWYRLNTSGHNTLRYDGANQQMGQRARMHLDTSDCCAGKHNCHCATVDMTETYAAHGVSATRSIAMVSGSEPRLLILDELSGSSNASVVTWQMHTYASISVATPSAASMAQDGKTLLVALRNQTECPGASFASVDVQLQEPQHPSNGLRKLVLTAPAATCRRIAVEMRGGASQSKKIVAEPFAATVHDQRNSARWRQSEFLISFWVNGGGQEYFNSSAPHADMLWAQSAAMNFTATQQWFEPPSSWPQQIDLARRNKMKAMLRACGATFAGGAARQYIGCERVAPNALPSSNDEVLGFWLSDEPSAPAFKHLANVSAEVARRFPGKLRFINLLPSYAMLKQLGAPSFESYVQRFVEEVQPDVLCLGKCSAPFASSCAGHQRRCCCQTITRISADRVSRPTRASVTYPTWPRYESTRSRRRFLSGRSSTSRHPYHPADLSPMAKWPRVVGSTITIWA